MHWLQVQIDLGTLPADTIEQSLLEMGALAIQYSDAGDSPIFEPAPGTTPLWITTQISALFDGSTSEIAIQLNVAKTIAPAPIPDMHFAIIEDENWVAKWRGNLAPMQFGQHLWICPPGNVCPDDEGKVVTMEPGLGFGTGAHATTRLCLEWLSHQQLRNKTVLDFGCGSGVLGIASLALGARQATAVDIDENALRATRENSIRNNCLGQLQVLPADRLDQVEKFDVVVANILSNTLIELEPGLRHYCHCGASIALSGILPSQADEVISAYKEWAELNNSAQQDEWVILTGTVN
jgi:ribosomal protein L11 methyltransferase